MVLVVLPHAWQVLDHLDAMGAKLLLRANAIA